MTLCAPNIKCFTQRFLPIGGAQSTSNDMGMKLTTRGKISWSLLVIIRFRQWRVKNLLERFAKHLLQKTFKRFHLQNSLQPKFQAKFGGCVSRQWLPESKKVSFFVTQTNAKSFGWAAKVLIQSVRKHEEILCGLTNGRASLCILLGPHRYSLAPCNHLLHQRATKKVSSPNLKCSVFCRKHTKKVVSYLTSILTCLYYQPSF